MSHDSFLAFHGGDLQTASRLYGHPVEGWIDLSTGINPMAYPYGQLPASAFVELPYLSDDFLAASEDYYGRLGVPVAGSQEAIERLPHCLEKLPVLVPDVGYKEYERQFLKAGFKVSHYPAFFKEASLAFLDQAIAENAARHLVVINPNNPTGLLFSQDELKALAGKLDRGGRLIVDEAFIDLIPDTSLLSHPLPDNCLVLRSFGKFFGLAGLRLGFCFGSDSFLQRFKETLSPWRINGPAQAVATKAYTDTDWITGARESVIDFSERQQTLMTPLIRGLMAERQDSPGLFYSLLMDKEQAESLFRHFVSRGILMREVAVSRERRLLRLGLFDPVDDNQLQRFIKAVEAFS